MYQKRKTLPEKSRTLLHRQGIQASCPYNTSGTIQSYTYISNKNNHALPISMDVVRNAAQAISASARYQLHWFLQYAPTQPTGEGLEITGMNIFPETNFPLVHWESFLHAWLRICGVQSWTHTGWWTVAFHLLAKQTIHCCCTHCCMYT